MGNQGLFPFMLLSVYVATRGPKSGSPWTGLQPGENAGLCQEGHLEKDSLPIHLCELVKADLVWRPLKGFARSPIK